MKSFLLQLFWSPHRTAQSATSTSSSTSSASSLLVATVSVILFWYLQISKPRLLSSTKIAALLLLLHQVKGGFTTSKSMIQRSIRQKQIFIHQPLFRNHSLRHCVTTTTTATQAENQQSPPWRANILKSRQFCKGDHNETSLEIVMSTNNNAQPATNVSTTSLEQQEQSMLWTVCCKCHGKGRMFHRSRKARRLQKKLLNGPRNDEIELGESIQEGNVSITICKFCQGSGLMQQQQEQLLSSPSQVSPMKSFDTITDQKRRPIHVAIIGGGIGGLAFAAACQHRNIHVTVYERDTHFTQRKQGYGLTLQQASKQLMGLGILPEKLTSATSCGITSTKHIVHDAKGNVKGTWGLRHWLGDGTATNNCDITKNDVPLPSLCLENDKCQSTPVKSNTVDATYDLKATQSQTKQPQSRRRQNIHIARQALRYELYLAATANEHRRSDGQQVTEPKHSIIQWNHRLVKYDERDDGVELKFAVSDANETTRTVTAYADILVGADGIRSQVRQQFFGPEDSAQLRYLDCIVILGICPLSELEANVVQSTSFGHLLDGETVFQTADGVTRIYMMPYSKSEYMWQLSFPIAESDAKDLSARGSVALRNIALSRCRTWHSPIPEILNCTPNDLITGYPVYDRELVQPHQLQRHNRPHSRRITFIGDAIHCMSPFKGQGANQALLDALSLARCLYKAIRIAEKQYLDKRETNHCNDEVGNAKKQKCGANEQKFQLGGKEIEQVLENYEHEMLSRSAVKVKASADAAHFLHTDIAIQEGDITRGTAAAILRKSS